MKFAKMAAGRHLEFNPTGNGAVESAVPENPTLEPNMIVQELISVGPQISEFVQPTLHLRFDLTGW